MKYPHRHESTHLDSLPEPDDTALEHSRKLVDKIIEEIGLHKGCIGFERFMGLALYEPGLGYYSAGSRKFGKDGDFTTAPEISALFSACIARQCEQVFELIGSSTILELGAGSGVMACDIISDLNNRGSLPDKYLILETSADLRDRQQKLLNQTHPQYFHNVQWLDSLPKERIDGVILANEVLDAIPINRIQLTDGNIYDLMVGHVSDEFNWLTRPADNNNTATLISKLEDVFSTLPDGYVTEYNALIFPFLRSLSEVLASGSVFIIDYGYPRHEYYHPQRTEGTLVCHYRHRSHNDPFKYIGIQDITAFVDFTNVAESGHEVGLDVNGYTTQAGFLMATGIDNIIKEYGKGDEKNHLLLSQQAGQLLLPGQMGEKFKVMALTRKIFQPLDGFKFINHTQRL